MIESASLNLINLRTMGEIEEEKDGDDKTLGIQELRLKVRVLNQL